MPDEKAPTETKKPAKEAAITTLAQLRDEHMKKGTSPSTKEIAAMEILEKENTARLSKIKRKSAADGGGR